MQKDIEKYSSAFTLSDMEIFVFPELMYSLLLANIMSPVIWQWRNEDCFVKLDGKSPYKKLMRLKQFIMDNFEFNLDLQTWGLTDKDTELKRFEKFISPDDISNSNALFGYHGDEYYFDLDIRRHFGLDKYDGNTIPYWKTETLEAMNAFRFRQGYSAGAGECVSLSAIYAAAAFVVCGIRLEDIYMILTPLHSQNFIDVNGGVITNNRRLVTKSMWYNGTELSNKAQRALRNEQTTIVAHNSGLVHCFYDEATIDKNIYSKFLNGISSFLHCDLDITVMANFLRCHNEYQKYFQFCRDCHGQAKFIKAETLFHYEHESNFRIADSTHDKLLGEVDEEDFSSTEFKGRIRCDNFKQLMAKKKPCIDTADGRRLLCDFFAMHIEDAESFMNRLYDFLHIEPKFPKADKKFISVEPIRLTADMSRQDIIDYLSSIRSHNVVADLAFYAYRDMTSCNWDAFIKAAVQRSPVSIEKTKNKSIEEIYSWLITLPNESIYDGQRMAQPDEVANYQRGDGLEKAFLLANVFRSRDKDCKITITASAGEIVLNCNGSYKFISNKDYEQQFNL